MLLILVHQGSAQWAAHRATHFNASEAAAMLGVCPYRTREQLLQEKKSGIRPLINPYTQRLFVRGHQFEKWARPLAEKAVGDDLFPCVGVLENTLLSASFDGLTLDNNLVWEHKTLNQTLRGIIPSNEALPLHYRVQLEQQLFVSGATKALFMASAWNESGELLEQYQRDYFPDFELRQRIILGWQHFEQDLADYELKTPLETKGHADELPVLPALYFQANGELSFSTNLDHFKHDALTVLNAINRNLIQEADFAHAETQIKWCKTGEDQLTHALTGLIERTPHLNEIVNTIKTIQAHMRAIRLDLDKQVKAEKVRVKNALIDAAIEQVKTHYKMANIEYLNGDVLVNKLESAIKGLKNLDKMQNAVDRIVIEEKTAFTQQLEKSDPHRLMSLEDINQAIAPLFINTEGLKQFGFVPAVNPATNFPLLIRRLIDRLATAALPEPLAQTA